MFGPLIEVIQYPFFLISRAEAETEMVEISCSIWISFGCQVEGVLAIFDCLIEVIQFPFSFISFDEIFTENIETYGQIQLPFWSC